MRTLVLAAALWIGACHHDAPAPAEPAGTPPLPPASGTPIGFLLDASELHLRDDQVAKLRDLDASLAAELEKLDAQTRAANRPSDADAAPAAAPSGGRGHHRGMGGMGGGGMGGGASGGMGGGGRSGGHHRRGGGAAGSASPSGGAAATTRLADERTADVKLALQRAFEVLDPDQQTAAKKVLSDHDVDLDLGAAPTRAAPSSDDSDPAPEP